MPGAAFHFPKGFLWGTATAAHQVEGNNTNNNWYAWEQEGRTVHKSGLACDWWGDRWREDFDRAAEGGQNAHRLSVEWSRIQPAPDRWDESALERYRLMLSGLRERGMTPLVTLHHFTDPLWISERGGWETESIIPLFEKFIRKTVGALKDDCTLWCTINEPNVYAVMGYAGGIFPPGRKDLKRTMQVLANMARGHAAAYRAIHEIQPEARVGYAWHYRPMVPARAWFPLDRLVCDIQYRAMNETFPSALRHGVMRSPLGSIRIPEARETQDYVGINYYSQDTVAFDLRYADELFGRRYYPEGSDVSEVGMNANIPQGLFTALRWAARFNLPIIITENGIEDAHDHIRPRYLAQHVHQVWRALECNWPIKGYFHWTLVDNFEWERGWTQRFGLWELDVETQARRKRPSADLYAEICKKNGLADDTVSRYCPEIFDRLFS